MCRKKSLYHTHTEHFPSLSLFPCLLQASQSSPSPLASSPGPFTFCPHSASSLWLTGPARVPRVSSACPTGPSMLSKILSSDSDQLGRLRRLGLRWWKHVQGAVFRSTFLWVAELCGSFALPASSPACLQEATVPRAVRLGRDRELACC